MDTLFAHFVAQLNKPRAALNGRPGDLERVAPCAGGGIDDDVEAA